MKLCTLSYCKHTTFVAIFVVIRSNHIEFYANICKEDVANINLFIQNLACRSKIPNY